MVLDARRFDVPRQRIQFALEPRDHAPVRPPRICEDDQEGISHRGLFMKVVHEAKDALDARVEHERFQAVNDQSAWTAFVEERGRRGVDVLQPAWIGGPGRSDRGDAKDLPALRGSLWPFGRQPEERRVRLREEPEERGDGIVGVEREIAQAPPERWGDSTPPFCMCRRAAVNAHFTPSTPRSGRTQARSRWLSQGPKQ